MTARTMLWKPMYLVLAFLAGATVVQSQEPVRFTPLQPLTLAAPATLTNAFADYDGDGDSDLFVGFNGATNRFYRNDAGTFTDIAVEVGLAERRPTRAAAWGDYDGDGDPDILLSFIPSAGAGILKLHRNDSGRFVDVTATAGLARDSGSVRQLAWIDVDGDGDLDLFVALRDRPNALYRNESGRFTEVATLLGLADARRSVGAVWFDYDSDGDLDLYVANQDGDANGLFRNDSGRFTDVAAAAGVAWGGRLAGDARNGTVRPCAADVDGDGRLDLFMANYGRNGLFLNRDGTFEDVSSAWGIDIDARYDTCAFSDFDHDGRVDLYVNGTVSGGVSYRDHLFRNSGTRFMDVTPASLLELHASHGVQWADVDADGDEDLALAGSRPDTIPLVMRNDLPSRVAVRSLLVRVLDHRGLATAAGAEVRLYAAGTSRLLGMRLVDSGSGYNGQSDVPVHFGLAQLSRVDVEVTFPSRGERRAATIRNVDPAGWTGRAVVIRLPAK